MTRATGADGGRDDADFDAFFRATYPRAVSLARRFTRGRADAEDAAIEALARAHRRWARLGPAPWREAWVFKVTVNEALRLRPPVGTLSSVDDIASAPEDVALRLTLLAALRELPRRQREVIVLRYLLGFSEADVADTLHISHNTLKTHVRRGVARLRASLGTDPQEEFHVQFTQ